VYFGIDGNQYGMMGPQDVCYLQNSRLAVAGNTRGNNAGLPYGTLMILNDSDLDHVNISTSARLLHTSSYQTKVTAARCDKDNDKVYVDANWRWSAVHPYF
jgi:hypothetical protein